MANENMIHIDKDNFEQEVINSEQPVLIDFWASWCGPCMMLGPIIEELAVQYAGKVKIAKVNVDEQSKLASNFKIMSIPTVIIFNKGEIVEKAVGFQSKEKFEDLLNKYI